MSTPTVPANWPAIELAAFVRQQAEWRRTLARKFPKDSRNLRAITALEELASYVERLPFSDHHLTHLNDLDSYDDETNAFIAGPAALRVFSRYGFDDALLDQRGFLQDLVAAANEDRKRQDGRWSFGVGTFRFDYRPGYVARHRGEEVDVLAVVGAPQGTPLPRRSPDGAVEIELPRHFDSATVRFRVQARRRGARAEWVLMNDIEEVPHPTADAEASPDQRWFLSDLDGGDTYRFANAPWERGVVSKFDLASRDVYKRRLVGDYIQQERGFRDVFVTVEPGPVESTRFVRLVRCAGLTPEDPKEAREEAVRAYLTRCALTGTPPSGWARLLVPTPDIEVLKIGVAMARDALRRMSDVPEEVMRYGAEAEAQLRRLLSFAHRAAPKFEGAFDVALDRLGRLQAGEMQLLSAKGEIYSLLDLVKRTLEEDILDRIGEYEAQRSERVMVDWPADSMARLADEERAR